MMQRSLHLWLLEAGVKSSFDSGKCPFHPVTLFLVFTPSIHLGCSLQFPFCSGQDLVSLLGDFFFIVNVNYSSPQRHG